MDNITTDIAGQVVRVIDVFDHFLKTESNNGNSTIAECIVEIEKLFNQYLKDEPTRGNITSMLNEQFNKPVIATLRNFGFYADKLEKELDDVIRDDAGSAEYSTFQSVSNYLIDLVISSFNENEAPKKRYILMYNLILLGVMNHTFQSNQSKECASIVLSISPEDENTHPSKMLVKMAHAIVDLDALDAKYGVESGICRATSPIRKGMYTDDETETWKFFYFLYSDLATSLMDILEKNRWPFFIMSNITGLISLL